MQRIIRVVFAFLLAVAALPGAGFAAGFSPGNIVVLRAGDGSGALSSAAAAVFLDEYSTSGSKAQSLALPIAVSGSNKPLTVAGSSTADGALRRSVDGRYLTLAGYAAAPGTLAIAGTTSAATNRVVGRVDASGAIDTTTSLSGAYSTYNMRGAVSNDGTGFWTVGSGSGVQYVAFGSTGASTTINSAAPTNLRVPGIYNGQLYVSSSSGSYQGVGTVGSGLPTAGPVTPTLLSGFPTAAGHSPYGFFFADANTIYLADDGNISTAGGGIQKWTLSAGTWSLAKTMNNGTALRSVIGSVSGSNVVLYAVTTESSANKLVTVTDVLTETVPTFPAFTTLATAPTNTAFRGVDFAPTSPTVTLSTATAGTGSGYITGANSTYNIGSTATITANPNTGSTFSAWSGCSTATTATINLTMDASKSCTANFVETLIPVDGACGTDNGKTLAATAPSNLCATGAASAVTGNGHPWNWSCAGSNGGNTPSCTASIQSYTLTFAHDGNGTLSGTNPQTVDFGGTSSPVTAQPISGGIYNLHNWTGTNGFTTTTSNPLTVSNVSASQTITANFKGGFTIFHVNDTHARVTPHKWVVTEHGNNTTPVFEDVGGAAFLAGEMLQLTAAQPNSLVLDAGDISEGNPIGDMNGNGAMTQFYSLLTAKLKAQRGRGIDAMVIGNHDVRDATYMNNIEALRSAGVPVISANLVDVSTGQPHFPAYTTVTINGTKIGILGYTTSASEVGASLSSSLAVVACDWSGTAAPCHLADYVNTLRNTEGCDVVVLLAHVGHSAIVDPTTPLLVDNAVAKVPEVVVTGHWHTWADTVWQPEQLNYKTIFTESDSYMKFIGELKVTDNGAYVSSTQHVVRDADITPDPEVKTLIDNITAQYDAAHPGHPVDEIIGYTADNLMLDNTMKWWSANEYPWSGNNTAGEWICDALRWKAEQLFGQCDLSIESGGGVRSDIPAGPVSYLQAYETYPWGDDFFARVNMTGQEVVNYLKLTNMDAGFSSALDVTAFDGISTGVLFNGQPIDLNHTYTVAISNYMYSNPPTGWTWSDTAPKTSSYLCRDGLIDYMRSQHGTSSTAYQVGGDRYHLNTEFSGGYRAVVTMMNDNDTKPTFDDAFIRFLAATPETLARLGSHQVPADLVNADGSINPANRLAEAELFRSTLGFKTGVLKPGDIIETWGKGSFYGGDPEFVDQEGIYADGVEFKIVGHDESLAKPVFMSSVNAFWNDQYKNHYLQFLAKKSGTSSATDQNGQTVSVMDVTGYASKTLPGNLGDTLLISGVLTMDGFGLRFRCDHAATGTVALPAASAVSSRLAPVAPGTSASSINLSATASVNSGTYYLTPLADAQVESGSPASNYGTGTNLYLQSAASGSYGNERAWLKFDLSGIPSGSTISAASLQLWNWKSTGASLNAEVHGGSDDSWTEGGLNWNNQPAFADTALDTQTLASGSSNLWYSWNVTSFAQGKMSGNKLVSLVVKPVTEGSGDATSPSYGFDAKEYGSNTPVLQVTTLATGNTVAQVQFFYRYSSDNSNWGSWTSAGVANTGAPYTANFSFPATGYYEFYSQATDSGGNVEPVAAIAQTATYYTATPAWYPMVSLSGLYRRYDGASKSAAVSTIPSGTSVTVTYNGSQVQPTAAGTYAVSVTPQGSTVAINGVMNIVKGMATDSFDNLNYVYDGQAQATTVSTIPSGVTTVITYNGSSSAPTNAGSYPVQAVISDPNYQGSTIAGTLTIAKASAGVSLSNLNFTYDGAAKPATVSTTPPGLGTVITYNGSTTQPSSAGTYAVVAAINDPNYQGGATGTLTIAPNPASSFSVTTSGFVNNRAAKTYHGTMTIKNISQATVSSPSGVQLNNLTAGVTLTSMVVPPVQSLAPGMSISASLDFSNPLNKPITFTPVLLP